MIKLANKIALASLLEVEKGMEKKAWDLSFLLRMSRNAAKRGKLSRFSELLDKRNLAIDNVAHVRANAAKQQRAVAEIEKALLGIEGPESKAYRRLVNRSVASNGDPNDIRRIIRDKELHNTPENARIGQDLFHDVAGPWQLKDLAAYGTHQRRSNMLDVLSYP